MPSFFHLPFATFRQLFVLLYKKKNPLSLVFIYLAIPPITSFLAFINLSVSTHHTSPLIKDCFSIDQNVNFWSVKTVTFCTWATEDHWRENVDCGYIIFKGSNLIWGPWLWSISNTIYPIVSLSPFPLNSWLFCSVLAYSFSSPRGKRHSNV